MFLVTVFYRKHFLHATVLFLTLSLFGCAHQKPLLGDQSPVLAITDAKAVLLKADELDAATYAPLEMERAQKALSQGEEIWKKYERRSGSTGTVKWDDKIRENVLYAKLYSQLAQAISKQKQVEQKITEAEKAKLRYEALVKKYQAEQAQLTSLLNKQKKLEAERRAAELLAQKAAREKEEAQRQKAEAEAARLAALKEKELAELAKQAADEAAKRADIKAKELAELARQEKLAAQQQKEAAELAKQETLKAKKLMELARQEKLAAQQQKEAAELAKLEALREAEAAKQQLQEMQKKLALLSSEFAKVKEEKRGLVVTLSDILFDVDKATIKPGSAKNLDYLAQILKEYPNRKIIIEGHTDSSGSEEHNQALSEERAFAVMGHLISRNIDPQMMDARGYGESKPVASNETPEGRQQNRRVDIIILNPEKG
jgi:outer membrane protein OmpA-like peptidoglycan-associated protein